LRLIKTKNPPKRVLLKAEWCKSIPGLHPKRVNQPWNVAQQGQNNIQNECPAKPFTDKHAKGGKQNRDNYAPKAHKLSCSKKIQLLVMKINFHFKRSRNLQIRQKCARVSTVPETQKPAIGGFFIR
jgi:hypothetical protein